MDGILWQGALCKVSEASFFFESETALQDWALRCARRLKGKEIFLLHGEAGSGKTSFSRAVIKALCGDITVPSPTYTLVQIYPAVHFDIWHADFYRLKHQQELDALGILESPEHSVKLIEWPFKIGKEWYSQEALHVQFDFIDDRSNARWITARSWGIKENFQALFLL